MSNHTPVPSATKEEFGRRVAAFSKASKVPEETVKRILAKMGVNEHEEDCIEMLDSDTITPIQDFFKHFGDDNGVPIARIRMGFPYIRGNAETEEPDETLLGGTEHDMLKLVKQVLDINKSAEAMTDQELLSLYDSGRPEIIERLARLSRGRPCIILNGDGTVNVTESSKLLKLAAKGVQTKNRHKVGNRNVRVYIPGKEFNVKPMDESPFYMGKILIDDYCSESDTDWKGVSHEARVMVRIYVHEVEVTKLSKMQMKNLCKDAKNGFEFMYNNYSEAANIYDEWKELGRLPSLKIAHADVKEDNSIAFSQALAGRTKDKGFI